MLFSLLRCDKRKDGVGLCTVVCVRVCVFVSHLKLGVCYLCVRACVGACACVCVRAATDSGYNFPMASYYLCVNVCVCVCAQTLSGHLVNG